MNGRRKHSARSKDWFAGFERPGGLSPLLAVTDKQVDQGSCRNSLTLGWFGSDDPSRFSGNGCDTPDDQARSLEQLRGDLDPQPEYNGNSRRLEGFDC